MSGETGFYPRTLLTLELTQESSDIQDVISNLKSSLKLALILVDAIFTKGGESLKDLGNIDETKKIAFGLGSAEKLGL